MRKLVKGERLKLADITDASTLKVGLELNFSGDHVFEICCFGLDAEGKLSDPNFFLYHHRRSQADADRRADEDHESFYIDLNNLSPNLERLWFTVSIISSGTMDQLAYGHWRLSDAKTELALFPFRGNDFLTEKSLIIGEIYRKAGVWRIGAMGQGFTGGTKALFEHVQAPESVLSRWEIGQETSAPVFAEATFVILEDAGDKLAKKALTGPFQLTLEYGSSHMETRIPDCYLGCFYRLKDGQKGVIQLAGDLFGNGNTAPFIALAADDQGEILYVLRPSELTDLVVFAYSSQGALDLAHTSSRLMIIDPLATRIGVKLENHTQSDRFYSICRWMHEGDRLRIEREGQYFADHRAADQHYEFGFQWRPGPYGVLIPD